MGKYPNIDQFNTLQREVGAVAADDDPTFKEILLFVDSLPSKGFSDEELYVILKLFLNGNSERAISRNVNISRKELKKTLQKFEGVCKEFLRELNQ